MWSDTFPTWKDKIIQRNVRAQAYQAPYVSPSSCPCSCVSKLLAYCEKVLEERSQKPKEGALMIFETETYPYWTNLDYSSHMWIYQESNSYQEGLRPVAKQPNVERLPSNSSGKLSAGNWVYIPPVFHEYCPGRFGKFFERDMGTYFLCVPFDCTISITELARKGLTYMSGCDFDLSSIVTHLDVVKMSGYTYLSYKKKHRTFISKPITNEIYDMTIAIIPMREPYTLSLQSESYSLESIALSDESLGKLQSFIRNKEQNTFDLTTLPECPSIFTIVKDPTLVDYVYKNGNRLGVLHERCESLETWVCLTYEGHDTVLDETVKVQLDLEGNVYHCVKPTKQDFRFVFRTFVTALLDNHHVWELCYREEDIYVYQSTSYLRTKFS